MLFNQVGDNMYACPICAKTYKKGNGYTNLLNHMRRKLADYEQDAQEAARRQNPLNLRLVSRRTRDLPLVGVGHLGRWSSTYEMVKRYVKIQPFIIQLGHGVLVKHGVQSLLLRRAQQERVKALLEDPAAFEAVTKELQKTTLTLSAVRRLFDQIIKLFPALKTRLAVTAPIVNFPNLEMGLVNLQRGEPLNLAKKAACAEFSAPSRERSPGNATEESSIVKAAFKRRKVAKHSHFVDVSYIPPTSNECERFFSAAKLVLTDLRKRMAPRKLEMVILLHN